jgi:hypothetical protein
MTQEKKIVPDSWFYSEFRNLLDIPLWVWWAGEQGRLVQPGARFKLVGDPRLPAAIPGLANIAASIRKMVEAGRIEFCSSPAVILDNQLPDGQSLVLQAADGSPVLTGVPTAEAAAARVLPIYEPFITQVWNEANTELERFIIDWSDADATIKNAGEGGAYDLNDQYKVIVNPPTGRPQPVQNGVDRVLSYIPRVRTGAYTFQIVVVAVDGRTQEGTAIVVPIAPPVIPPDNTPVGLEDTEIP